jgi:hypothetical protein
VSLLRVPRARDINTSLCSTCASRNSHILCSNAGIQIVMPFESYYLDHRFRGGDEVFLDHCWIAFYTEPRSSAIYDFCFLTGRFQSLTVFCSARVTASSSGGTSRVITDPAPIVAPSPTVTGATNAVLEPMKALSPMTV